MGTWPLGDSDYQYMDGWMDGWIGIMQWMDGWILQESLIKVKLQ